MTSAPREELREILMDGETVLYDGKPQKTCYVFQSFSKLIPIALIFLCVDGFFIYTFLLAGIPKGMLPFIIGFFALHLLPVWKCIAKIITAKLEYKNIIYAITNRRVIIRDGIVGLDYQNVTHEEISNINVYVGVIEHFFRTGTIIVTTTSGYKHYLRSVNNPYEVHKMLNKVHSDVKTDVFYPNALRPDNNPGYKTTYEYK